MDGETDGRVEAADTFPRLIRAAAAAFGETPAILLRRDGVPDETLTFAGLERRSAELARGLIAWGAGKGTRIGFVHGNGPSFLLMLAAITRVGGVAVPVSTLLKSDELVRVLRQSDVAGLIVQRTLLGHDLVERVCDALPALCAAGGADLRLASVPFLRWIVSDGADLPPAVRPLKALEAAAGSVDPQLLAEIELEIYPTDQMIEIYTSGSMALPKGVRHDHGPAMFRARYLRRMIDPPRGAERAVPLPMFWVGGLMMTVLPGLVAGAISVCSEGTVTSSRMAMGSVLAPEDLALMAGYRPFWALGMSETLGPYSHGTEFRAAGRPVCAPLDTIADGFEVRVVDEQGQPVGDGMVGEIQVRGYALAPGLHKMERDHAYTVDGFYRTGDLGLREGTRIHFVGRNGDIIKSAGSNVSPAEVEMEMQRIDGIESAYVVGLPDAERGQLVVAAVVVQPGVAIDFEAVRQTLRARLSPFKVPRAYVAIQREEVPMLASNKVARRQIERMMGERLARTA